MDSEEVIEDEVDSQQIITLEDDSMQVVEQVAEDQLTLSKSLSYSSSSEQVASEHETTARSQIKPI